MRSAAEQLQAVQTKRNQPPQRNYAIFLTLLHLGLHESEMLSLRSPHTARGYLHNVKRFPKSVREALDDYFEYERGPASGPLFIKDRPVACSAQFG